MEIGSPEECTESLVQAAPGGFGGTEEECRAQTGGDRNPGKRVMFPVFGLRTRVD